MLPGHTIIALNISILLHVGVAFLVFPPGAFWGSESGSGGEVFQVTFEDGESLYQESPPVETDRPFTLENLTNAPSHEEGGEYPLVKNRTVGKLRAPISSPKLHSEGQESGGIGVGLGLGSSEAQLLSQFTTPYPSDARRRGIEGRVLLQLDISAEGRVNDTKVVESSGSSILDDAARISAGEAIFAPATLGGLRVGSSKKIALRFTLNE